MTMTLVYAQALVAGTLAEATRRAARPLGVVVVDAGGHVVAAARQDGAAHLRIDIARAKASGAIGMGSDTRALAERAAGNPAFFQSLAVVAGGRVALSPGGLLISGRDGHPIGAIGVSGDTADIDEACAAAAIAACDSETLEGNDG